jgi:hypothetical protein
VAAVRVLGPVEVWDGEVNVQLGPPRQRCVLAVLAMTPGQPVTPEALVDRVWGDQAGAAQAAGAARAAQPGVPAQLPPDPAKFVGRSAELARLDAMVSERAPTAVPIAIEGMAGVGNPRWRCAGHTGSVIASPTVSSTRAWVGQARPLLPGGGGAAPARAADRAGQLLVGFQAVGSTLGTRSIRWAAVRRMRLPSWGPVNRTAAMAFSAGGPSSRRRRVGRTRSRPLLRGARRLRTRRLEGFAPRGGGAGPG